MTNMRARPAACTDQIQGCGSRLGFGGFLKPFDRDKFRVVSPSNDLLQALQQSSRPGTCREAAAHVLTSLVPRLATETTLSHRTKGVFTKRPLADLQSSSSTVTGLLKSHPYCSIYLPKPVALSPTSAGLISFRCRYSLIPSFQPIQTGFPANTRAYPRQIVKLYTQRMLHKMAVHSNNTHPRGAARYLKVIDMKLFAWTMEHQFLFDDL